MHLSYYADIHVEQNVSLSPLKVGMDTEVISDVTPTGGPHRQHYSNGSRVG